MKTIAHLTLLTGHLRESPRKEVYRETIDLLKPYVVSAGGEIADTGWTVGMIQGAAPGSCAFTLNHSGLWLVTCYMAWTTSADAPMWEIVKQRTTTSTRKPKSVPWLAVHLMPSATQVAPQVLMQAGDLERCIAWTVIETMAGNTTHAV
jgi:hypothetical protein